MSMKDLEEAFLLIAKNFDDQDIDLCESQKISTIEHAEYILGCYLPHTYKQFISKYGCGNIGSFEIYGLIKEEVFDALHVPQVTIPNVVWTNLKYRKDFQHPQKLIILSDIGNGDSYCLDTSQMNDDGECPVVVWPIGGYEQTPVLEKVAEDFGEFFLNMVRQQIEYKKSQLL